MASTIAIRGNNLTTQVQSGSLAAAQSHQAGNEDYAASDNERWSSTTHRDLLTWWAEFNFGDRRLAPWASYDVEPEEDLQQNAALLNTVADGISKFRALGYSEDPALLEEFGLSELFTQTSAPQLNKPPVGLSPASGA